MNFDWQFDRALAADALWLSTLLLACGLLAARLWRTHPARGHRVVLLSLLAAIIAPLASQIARNGGWGMLSEPPAVATGPRATESTALPPLIVREPHRRPISATGGSQAELTSSTETASSGVRKWSPFILIFPKPTVKLAARRGECHVRSSTTIFRTRQKRLCVL